MSGFQVSVHVFEEFQDLVSGQRIREIAELSLEQESAEPSAALSVVVADDGLVTELNATHRGLEETTDVLAFSFRHQGEYYGEGAPPSQWRDGMPFPLPPGEEKNLGEVVISYPQARRQAAELGHSEEREVAHLVAHGVLHLLGYDHQEPDDEAAMRAREDSILARVLGASV